MRKLEELKGTTHLSISARITNMGLEWYHVYGGYVTWPDFKGTVIFAYDEDGVYEHVSVSCTNKNKLPSWDVMCRLKDMFFYPEETVIQIHPAESQYVHGVGGLKNVLHLWRPMNGDFSIFNDAKE